MPGFGIVTVPGGNACPGIMVPSCGIIPPGMAVIGISPMIGPSPIGISVAIGHGCSVWLLRWKSMGRAVLLHPPAPISPAVTTSPAPNVRPIQLTSPRLPPAAVPGDSLKKPFPTSRQHTNQCAQKTKPTGAGRWAWEMFAVSAAKPQAALTRLLHRRLGRRLDLRPQVIQGRLQLPVLELRLDVLGVLRRGVPPRDNFPLPQVASRSNRSFGSSLMT